MNPLSIGSHAATGVVTVLYDGWQVWDGQCAPVRVGGEITASVEFFQRSEPHVVSLGTALGVERLGGFRHLATARVVDTEGAVVLDLGTFRALRWVRPGETSGDFKTGQTISVQLGFGLNPWDGEPWTIRAAQLYGSHHRWRVDRIVRVTEGQGDEAVDLQEASMETVDDSIHHCLLDLSPLDSVIPADVEPSAEPARSGYVGTQGQPGMGTGV